MKKILLSIAAILTAAATSLMLFACTDAEAYKKEVEGFGIFQNTAATALPQTAFHDIAVEHFKGGNADGKAKKALLITLDGMRADTFSLIKDYGLGIMRLRDDGGIYLAYAGGEKKSYRTDTSPGTASLMTGIWADDPAVNVLTNQDAKGAEPESIFTTVAKEGYSVKLNAGWSTHITTTFKAELDAAKDAGLKVSAEAEGNAAAFQDVVLKSIAENDVTIAFYAEPDGMGHEYGFDLSVPQYCAAVVSMNAYIEGAIAAVKARPSYAEEDWLILISTDHGGQKDKNHYQASITERLIFIACNKELNAADYIHPGYELN